MTKKRQPWNKLKYWYDFNTSKWKKVPKGMKYITRLHGLGKIPENTDLAYLWQEAKDYHIGRHVSRLATKLCLK